MLLSYGILVSIAGRKEVRLCMAVLLREEG